MPSVNNYSLAFGGRILSSLPEAADLCLETRQELGYRHKNISSHFPASDVFSSYNKKKKKEGDSEKEGRKEGARKPESKEERKEGRKIGRSVAAVAQLLGWASSCKPEGQQFNSQ